MNKNELIAKASRNLNKVGFALKKYSPEIFTTVGVVGVVASGVMACKATTKLDIILDESKENIDAIHNAMEHPETLPEEYTPEDGNKDLGIVYVQTGVKIAKLYAPSIILGALSLTSIIASHKILRKRNVALASAYMTIDKSFKDYRGRVVERFGKELDRELKYNIKAKEIEEVTVDKKGKEKTEKKTVETVNPNDISDYARIFDCGNKGWCKDPEANLAFLKLQQNYANDKLKTKGYLFLNDVYKMLGFPETKAGQCVGWVYDNPNGDGFVDFGLYELSNPRTNDFVNGFERSVILNFNVDGPILDLM